MTCRVVSCPKGTQDTSKSSIIKGGVSLTIGLCLAHVNERCLCLVSQWQDTTNRMGHAFPLVRKRLSDRTLGFASLVLTEGISRQGKAQRVTKTQPITPLDSPLVLFNRAIRSFLSLTRKRTARLKRTSGALVQRLVVWLPDKRWEPCLR